MRCEVRDLSTGTSERLSRMWRLAIYGRSANAPSDFDSRTDCVYDSDFGLMQKEERNYDEVADPEYLSWAPAIHSRVMTVETGISVHCVESQHVHRKDCDSAEEDNGSPFCDGVRWYQRIVSDLEKNDESRRSPLESESENGIETVNEAAAV